MSLIEKLISLMTQSCDSGAGKIGVGATVGDGDGVMIGVAGSGSIVGTGSKSRSGSSGVSIGSKRVGSGETVVSSEAEGVRSSSTPVGVNESSAPPLWGQMRTDIIKQVK